MRYLVYFILCASCFGVGDRLPDDWIFGTNGMVLPTPTPVVVSTPFPTPVYTNDRNEIIINSPYSDGVVNMYGITDDTYDTAISASLVTNPVTSGTSIHHPDAQIVFESTGNVNTIEITDYTYSVATNCLKWWAVRARDGEFRPLEKKWSS